MTKAASALTGKAMGKAAHAAVGEAMQATMGERSRGDRELERESVVGSCAGESRGELARVSNTILFIYITHSSSKGAGAS